MGPPLNPRPKLARVANILMNSNGTMTLRARPVAAHCVRQARMVCARSASLAGDEMRGCRDGGRKQGVGWEGSCRCHHSSHSHPVGAGWGTAGRGREVRTGVRTSIECSLNGPHTQTHHLHQCSDSYTSGDLVAQYLTNVAPTGVPAPS